LIWKKEKAAKKPGKAGYIAVIAINAVMIYVFNNLLKWGVPFLTSEYSGVLWAINLSLSATIIANILFFIYDAGWFRHMAQIVLNIIALFVIFMIFTIFPFTFANESWAFWVKIALILVMAGIGIGTIVELFKLILRKD
jgi:hypothetical protein